MGREPHILRFRKGEIVLDHTVLMGVVNVTPDSFFDGGKYAEVDVAVAHALHLADQGAEIVDVGGESTRPGAESVSAAEEWRRVEPVLKALRAKTDARISIDTYKPDVAAKAVKFGADMVNDVTGLRAPKMRALVAKEGAAAVVMHMKGTPKTMQRNPGYKDVVAEVAAFLKERAESAVAAGVSRDRIVVDPGLGFGKTPEHNAEILRRLGGIVRLGYPVLVGPSRKWFVGAFGGGDVDGRLEGSIAAAVLAALNGADLVRVHDVESTAKALKVADAVARRAP